ncbi:amidohydrolase [Bacillus sp. Marseille-P3661]|uniref:amidohydrolase n=1 Tax=Bacillus sp. Marseille-P3661 TaxID=1936234 RepID=UPI000C82B98B|nr:amidohydrolase [Bacillus sp. Marseille-P3661]
MTSKDRQIFFNGKIFTANPNHPYASAMLICDGVIEKVADEKEMMDYDGDRINLQGRRVLPGLIDAHLHPLWLAKATKQVACTPPLVRSIEDMIQELRKQRIGQAPNNWIEGWGYDEGKLTDQRAPTRWDLDKVSQETPVVVTRTCTHIISVNSAALNLAGITESTENPPGGQIDKDLNGKPTGILRESARYLVLDIMPELSIEDSAALLAELSPNLLKHGITAITDLMCLREPIDYLELYKQARNQGLKQRAVLYYIWDEIKKHPNLDKNTTCKEKAVHIGGIKLFADGSVSGRTAWVSESFKGNDKGYGIATTSKEELVAAAQAAEQNAIQLVVHAMGDKAIDLIIDTFYDKKGWLTDLPSIRIEHAAMPTKETIRRAAKTNIAFVPQPIFIFAEIESYINNLGVDRTIQTYPFRSMLDAGIKVAFSSDAPATAWSDPANPFIAIKSAVTRTAYDGTDTGHEQRIDVHTAITLYTRLAQEITGIPKIGQLKEGYHADFIVLDRDIFNVNMEEIDRVIVDETYMGGTLVYRRNR